MKATTKCKIVWITAIQIILQWAIVSAVDECIHDELLPNLFDCTKFYQCTHGELVLHDCPDELHFSVETEQCEFPYHAQCVPSTESVETSTVNITESTTTTQLITEGTTTVTPENVTDTTLPSSTTVPTTTELITDTTFSSTTELSTEETTVPTTTTEISTTEETTITTTSTTEPTTTTTIETTTFAATNSPLPFDEFGYCLEYTTGIGYGYNKLFSIDEIGLRHSGYVEFKVYFQAAQTTAYIILASENQLSNIKSRDHYEITINSGQSYIIKRNGKDTLGTVSRTDLLKQDAEIPLIIRQFDSGLIEIQIPGERNPFMRVTDAKPINVRYVGFSSQGSTTGYWKWLYSCQINPVDLPSLGSTGCQQITAGPEFEHFFRMTEISNNKPNENLKLIFYVQTQNVASIRLSSVDYTPTGSPYYDIELGAQYVLRRRNTPIVPNKNIVNLPAPKKNFSVVITITTAGKIELTIDAETKPVITYTDKFVIDVRYISFSSGIWNYGCWG